MQRLIEAWNLIKLTEVVWGPFVSALIAAFIVHLLTQSREWEKWLLDCKKQEYRELLDALSNLFIENLDSTGNYDGEKGRPLKEAAMHFTRIVRDRLYITNDLPLQQLETEWYRGECIQHLDVTNGENFNENGFSFGLKMVTIWR